MKLTAALLGALALACGPAYAQTYPFPNAPYAGEKGTGAPSTSDQILVQQGVTSRDPVGSPARMTLGTLQGLIGGLPFSGGTLTGPLTAPGITSTGAKCDGSTDDTAAIQAAVNASVASGWMVVLPRGTCRLAGSITATIPAGVSLTLAGQGADATVLKFDAGVSGIALTFGSQASSFHVRDMTIAAGGNTAGTVGFSATLATAPQPAWAAQSDFTNVTFRGADGYAVADFWDTGVYINGVSNVSYTNVNVEGNAAKTATDCVHIVGTSNAVAVVHNFSGGSYNNCTNGIFIDTWTQGITVNQANFTGGPTGIYEPDGTGITEVVVTASQFNNSLYGVYDHNGVNNTFAHNLFIVDNASAKGIDVLSLGGTIIQGNTFRGNNSASAFAIQIESAGSLSIVDNIFSTLTKYWFSTASRAYTAILRNNQYLDNTNFSFGTGATAILDFPQTFAQLTACASSLEGRTASVTDSATATPGGTITSGGANHVPAYCNGTNWIVQ